jgi:undecaprenyl-diphosphatase
VVVALVAVRGVTHAQGFPAEPPREGEPSLSYLYDGGALPFFWLPALGSLAIDRYWRPRASPLYFDPYDGGAKRATWENPAWTMHIAAVGLGAGMALGGDDSRWYHVKGLAQTLATSSLVTSVLKSAFGRHRPDWVADVDNRDVKSFPSGHTTAAFAVATYAGQFLHGHVFGDGTSSWAAGAAYGGLLLGASLVGGERVYHARHHLSDVVAGALIGTATSIAMYRFQEYLYRHRGDETIERKWRLAPSFQPQPATVGLSGVF